MVLSPYFPDRAFLIVTVFSVITLGSILTQMEFRVPEIIKRNIALLAVVVLIGLSPSFYNASMEIMRLYLRWYDRVEIIIAEKGKDNLDVEVSSFYPFYPKGRHVVLSEFDDITPDENHWFNTEIARYFGLKSIKSNDVPIEPLWTEKGKRIRQIIIPIWKIIKQARNK